MYHAREVGIRRAELSGGVVLLGSATPSIESYYHARRGTYVLLRLPRRVLGVPHGPSRPVQSVAYRSLPEVEVVDMRAELRAGNRSILSRALHAALGETLEAGEQAILFLNRRGSATFVLCRDCGLVLRCRRCDLPMAYHGQSDRLVCHHCNWRSNSPRRCPSCGGGRIRYFGAGTQRVEQDVQRQFELARVLRWDSDTAGRKGAHVEFLDSFVRGRANVLVGTQMVAKGLDLPLVTLVGVVSADTSLNLPDFRAGERTFQLLSQVIGRAGRADRAGRVIVQTYTPDAPSIRWAEHHDWASFVRAELEFRRRHAYPPYTRLVKLVHAHRQTPVAEQEATRLAGALRRRVQELGVSETEVIGPAPAFFGRVGGLHRWQVVVRSPEPHVLLRDIRLPPDWRVDVDPVSML
jgi:primosomal protein N' (replication factor Y)